MTTQTKSLDQWLEECPNKLEFYSRFIDVKEDVLDNIKDYELGGEGKLQKWEDETVNEIVETVILDFDWSNYNTSIYQLVQQFDEETNND